jgi:single-strand DNA-binding protein
LRVVGRIKQNRWVGSDGKNTSKVTIIAEHIELKPQLHKTGQDEPKQEVAELADAAAALKEETEEGL